MADFAQGLDPGKLVFSGTLLAFAISPFAVPAYNLPILLFGTFAQEASDAVQSLKLFTACLIVSIPYDLIWMFKNEQSAFIRLLTITLFLLKFPMSAVFLATLRQRGSQFTLGTDVGGATVWSMPGGFTSSGRNGYQTVDDEPRPPPARIVSPQPPRPSATPGPQPAIVQPGAYQNA
ncbi:hypothetical protein SCLCIDRAFT_1211418 [Scleroderma citrinum Foug A]|uniref:Uncharacterized protein n=1 Tax=Scleroderma citrinum Foug A TaxID=1036808 RepID=A0A0C2ZXM1_9AGAM|nr:hypothetical protein SCLCIDRAFT_1211418 [Scleroderma citrinum Foug A]